MQTDARRVERDLDAVHTDQEGARSWMAGVCGPHELKVHSSRALGFRHSGTVLKSMATTLGYVEYGVDVSVRVHNSDPLNCFSVSLPVVGEQELTLEGGRIRSDRDMGTILLPSAPQELVIAGNCRKILVAITKPAIAGVLGDLLQRKLDKPVVFQPGIDAANGDTASWWRMVKYLLTETENGGSLYRDSLFTSDIETALIKGLLLAQPHNYSDELKAARAAKLPHYLLRAKEFILETAREEVCLEDVERVSGVSRFKLYEGFKQHFGMSPLAFRKKYRLEEVRRNILRSGSRSSISGIAMDWGFSHLGRFSIEYKKQFNELPSETLKRCRQNP